MATGLTQDALCDRVGMSKAFLSDIENGKRGMSADNLLKLAKVFRVSLDQLMTGKPGEHGCICHSCGDPYEVDVLVPDPVWRDVYRAANDGSGLLCGSCIMQRIEALHGEEASSIRGISAWRLVPL